jgi:serine O-acetyltransferase
VCSSDLCTAAGVPARIIGCVDVPEPALEMDQRI